MQYISQWYYCPVYYDHEYEAKQVVVTNVITKGSQWARHEPEAARRGREVDHARSSIHVESATRTSGKYSYGTDPIVNSDVLRPGMSTWVYRMNFS